MNYSGVTIEVKNADALDYEIDVLVLNHSQALYGLDSIVVQRFKESGINVAGSLPPLGEYKIFDAPRSLGAKKVLFVGTPRLGSLGYKEIRDFTQDVLSSLSISGDTSEKIAVTVHGVNSGLDEEEAFSSQLAVFVLCLNSIK